ncbi:hypothetical protein V9W62_12830 [Bacillus velezensis]
MDVFSLSLAEKVCEKWNFHIDQFKPLLGDTCMILKYSLDVIGAPPGKSLVKVSHALERIFQVRHWLRNSLYSVDVAWWQRVGWLLQKS